MWCLYVILISATGNYRRKLIEIIKCRWSLCVDKGNLLQTKHKPLQKSELFNSPAFNWSLVPFITVPTPDPDPEPELARCYWDGKNILCLVRHGGRTPPAHPLLAPTACCGGLWAQSTRDPTAVSSAPWVGNEVGIGAGEGGHEVRGGSRNSIGCVPRHGVQEVRGTTELQSNEGGGVRASGT